MRITSPHMFVLRVLLAAVIALPFSAYAYGYGEGGYYGQVAYYAQVAYYGYGQVAYYGYGQVTYYAQVTYYGQGSYQTTIVGNAQEKVNFSAAGNVSKASGSFVIDHPLDPKNKLLYHSFVESPDVKNLYDGIVTLNAAGEATVDLPAYFDALNTGIRYQLKPIGSPMPNLYVKSEEQNNQFSIGGGTPNGRVSWQITGIRHDPYIVANPIIPEVEKGPKQLVDRGEYLHPELYAASVFTYALPPHWKPAAQKAQ